jgi:hypothetical protein
MRGSPQFLSDVCAAVTEFLESYGQQDHCIDGSVILASVLHELGYPEAYPVTVRVRILNRALIDWIETHLDTNPGGEALVCDDDQAIEMKLGDEAAGDGRRWGGHLAVIIPYFFFDQHALLDITIGQVNRPEFGVLIPPLCLRIGNEVSEGKRVATIEVNDCHVIYQAFPNDHSFGDWHVIIAANSTREATEDICKRLK